MYNCTSDAPALANSKASFPEEIPPHPIKGILPSVEMYNSLIALTDLLSKGFPLKPPTSLAFSPKSYNVSECQFICN